MNREEKNIAIAKICGNPYHRPSDQELRDGSLFFATMKNPLVEKFERYLADSIREGGDSGWLREAILEIERLEGLLLESRMREAAYEIELNKRYNPVPGKQKANEKRLKELFRQMGIK